MSPSITETISFLSVQQLSDISLTPSLLIQTAVIAILLIYLLKYLKWSCRGLPPGPIGLPIFGYLPFLGREPYKKMAELGKKYGPVFSLQLGHQYAIILNDYDAIKEAFVKQGSVFAGRPTNNIFTSKGKEEVLAAGDGPIWKVHRQFAYNTLRNLGFGKTSIEPLIKEEIDCFLKEVRRLSAAPSDISDLLRRSIANNICVMIFGKRFDYDDPTFRQMNHLIDERIKRYNNVSSRLSFPWITKIPLLAKWTGHSELLNLQETLLMHVKKLVEEFKKSISDLKNRNCYIESYLEKQAESRKVNSKDSIFDDEKLEGNIIVLMAAGSDTVGLTMCWAIKYLILNSDVQKKIQEEIENVIGSERSPCWDDRTQLPYTWAAMMEIMRITSILPLNIAHSNIEETTLNNYCIPKRSCIISNLWAVHHDPEVWGDPDNFRPERFLTADGDIINSPYFIPFSVGPRTCLGESMARMEYFLYFTMLLQQFNLKPGNGSTLDLNCYPGFTLRPTEFKACFLPR